VIFQELRRSVLKRASVLGYSRQHNVAISAKLLCCVLQCKGVPSD